VKCSSYHPENSFKALKEEGLGYYSAIYLLTLLLLFNTKIHICISTQTPLHYY